MQIILEKAKCIGCGSCVSLCPQYFEMAEDGKSHLKESKFDLKTGKEELETENISCIKEAADVCPVQCIYIK